MIGQYSRVLVDFSFTWCRTVNFIKSSFIGIDCRAMLGIRVILILSIIVTIIVENGEYLFFKICRISLIASQKYCYFCAHWRWKVKRSCKNKWYFMCERCGGIRIFTLWFIFGLTHSAKINAYAHKYTVGEKRTQHIFDRESVTLLKNPSSVTH